MLKQARFGLDTCIYARVKHSSKWVTWGFQGILRKELLGRISIDIDICIHIYIFNNNRVSFIETYTEMGMYVYLHVVKCQEVWPELVSPNVASPSTEPQLRPRTQGCRGPSSLSGIPQMAGP